MEKYGDEAQRRARASQPTEGRQHLETRSKAVLTILMIVACAGCAALHTQATLSQGRHLCRLFYEEKLDSLYNDLAAPMKEMFGGLPGLKAFREQVAEQLGREVFVVSESAEFSESGSVYVRTARFEKLSDPIVVVWSLNATEKVIGFQFTPALAEAPSKYLEYRTKTTLHVPFDGEWYVFWGGRNVSQNYHAVSKDQRFAYDLLIMQDGSSRAGGGERNEDYYCFSKPILAPASGTVYAAEDGVEDNAPGVMNPLLPLGNYVILDHGNGEYSFLAHLRNGSVTVSKGDVVSTGDVLGECGNSGNSSEPHLHFHLQDSPVFGEGNGLPAQFTDYRADGEPVNRGEPVRSQSIRPT